MIRKLLIFITMLVITLIGVIVFRNLKYYGISLLLAITSCVLFYYKYEKKHPPTREIVLIAVMVTSCVLSRMLFIITPNFKPMYALIMIYGISFGSETGFICGSLSAFISNFIFGQGPWTPFQMIACALIGYIAGIFEKPLSKSKSFQIFFGIVTAFFYSAILDFYASISLEMVFNLKRYLVTLMASLPTTIVYAIANVIFLLGLIPILKPKFYRVKIKYGLYEGEYLDD